jgi:hypothetical protein
MIARTEVRKRNPGDGGVPLGPSRLLVVVVVVKAALAPAPAPLLYTISQIHLVVVLCLLALPSLRAGLRLSSRATGVSCLVGGFGGREPWSESLETCRCCRGIDPWEQRLRCRPRCLRWG